MKQDKSITSIQNLHASIDKLQNQQVYLKSSYKSRAQDSIVTR